MKSVLASRITAVRPLCAVEGGQVTISGTGFRIDPDLPEVKLAGVPVRLRHASPEALTLIVPTGLEGGRTTVRVGTSPGETAYVDIGAPIATGLHQVDNPAFDSDGNLYVTFSGSRGQQSPVSVYVVRTHGAREPYLADLPNPTSMAFDSRGQLHISSRFDGSVHRVGQDGTITTVATDLGVACGIAFGPDDDLYVGDRSGSILRVRDASVTLFASVPPSVAAFHLAFGPDGFLYVAGPTLASHDGVYRISREGLVELFRDGFGRPQGLAFDAEGNLYVADSLAGAGGVYRIRTDRRDEPEQLLSGGGLIGLAFDPRGGVVVASSDTVYRLDIPLRGWLYP